MLDQDITTELKNLIERFLRRELGRPRRFFR